MYCTAPAPRFSRNSRAAFTLIEAMIATAITAVAGGAILMGIASTLRETNDMIEQSQALGLAQQLMDEIAGNMYCQFLNDPYQTPLGPSATEAAGVCRERFNDIDDFAAFTTLPPKDIWGNLVGTSNGQGGQRDPNFRYAGSEFSNWRQTVVMYYVNPSNLSQALTGTNTSDYRGVEVRITTSEPNRPTRTLATLRRVFSYVPVQ